MSSNDKPSPSPLLSPFERISEVLFGLIMVITFTGSLSVATAGRDDVRTMLIGAIGCNLAWGIIDGVFYLLSRTAEKGNALKTYQAVLAATNPEDACRLIASALPPIAASLLKPEELESMRQRLLALPAPPEQAKLDKADWLGAATVFALVFAATFPVVLPFLFMQSAGPALRVSNMIAIGMLFVLGFTFGRFAGRSAWGTGLGMVLLGGALVGLTRLLGG